MQQNETMQHTQPKVNKKCATVAVEAGGGNCRRQLEGPARVATVATSTQPSGGHCAADWTTAAARSLSQQQRQTDRQRDMEHQSRAEQLAQKGQTERGGCGCGCEHADQHPLSVYFSASLSLCPSLLSVRLECQLNHRWDLLHCAGN